ncbi:hypothetical protein [Gallibacterium anatis]|uniref:hypothetical protein n=2 Tax=Gallibacterium anatis TaxID=750 RepID=UPI000531D240|nr:hypothetical protein [Gallibacterium anatis]KGQ46960.1 hypothetical protein JP29_00190 [Gallibacterium anatis]KGQ52965.1 hypothetical protein IO46_04955 [Gallibacterium anatis]KGQ68106.1 hypothetical protein IO47_06505 [Gallibacterium anatis]
MINKTTLLFYSNLIFFYFSDMALLMIILWFSYHITQSSLLLATILAISSIFPLIIRKWITKWDLLHLSLKALLKLRIFVYSFIALFVFFFDHHIFTFIVISLFFGLLSLTLLSTYETENTKLVLRGMLTANLAARLMQTVIQAGAFAGAMIGTLLLDKFSFVFTILAISSLDIFICSIYYFFVENTREEISKKEIKIREKSISKQSVFICITLGFIGLHISTFNLTTPIFFQEIHHWNASDFGRASGFAGIGAFLAVFIPITNRKWLLPIGLIFFDLLFVMNTNLYLMPVFCFLLGFNINSLRIFLREKLILLASNDQQATYLGGLSALYYTLFQAIGSLIIGILISKQFGILNLAQWGLPFIALLLWIFFLKMRGSYE